MLEFISKMVVWLIGWLRPPVGLRSRLRQRGRRNKITDTPIRILLDNGILTHSEFAEDAIKQTSVRWGDTDQVIPIYGLVRKAPDKDRKFQSQKEALFTIGRQIGRAHV